MSKISFGGNTGEQPALVAIQLLSNRNRIRAEPDAHIRLSYCEISYAGLPNHRAVDTSSNDFQMSQCRIHDTSGVGLFADNGTSLVINTVFSDNDQGGMWLVGTAHLSAYHSTIARNGIEISLDNLSQASLNYTILEANNTGVQVIRSVSNITLQNTLWDNNTTPVNGAIHETSYFSGPVHFSIDGYHIGEGSTAVDRGLLTEVMIDIDGESPLRPDTTPPDLGADEIENLIQVFIPMVNR